MSDVLTQKAIKEQLSNLKGWKFEDDTLKKAFKFGNFREAVAFIVRISYEAEDQVHHPEIQNVYNTVQLSLSTHDAGDKVTQKDINLAKAIEAI